MNPNHRMLSDNVTSKRRKTLPTACTKQWPAMAAHEMDSMTLHTQPLQPSLHDQQDPLGQGASHSTSATTVAASTVDVQSNLCIGMLKTELVAKQPLYFTKDEMYEAVLMSFEGRRCEHYSFNVTSRTRPVKFFGWVPFHDTKVLGPLTERGFIWWDALIPRNKINHLRIPFYIILYCRPTGYAAITQFLTNQSVDLLDPPFFNPACEYRKVTLSPRPHDRPNMSDLPCHHVLKKQIALLLDTTSTIDTQQPASFNANDLQWPGMTITLMPYQHHGIQWMIERERSSAEAGGILADKMGLGKTIQTIGLIVSTQTYRQKTLIVSPLALLHQWETEIKEKTTPGSLKAMVYHGTDRPRHPQAFDGYDIIITTYQMVSADMTDSSDVDGPLLAMDWQRVVLDEAQQIKNHTTRMARACYRLRTTKRWCLTGTPIQNRVEELYSLLHFLRIEPLCDLRKFRQALSIPIQQGNTALAFQHIKAILSVIMLRRTKHILHQQQSTATSSTSSPLISPTADQPQPTPYSCSATQSNVSSPADSSSVSSASSSSNLSVFGLPARNRQDILLTFSPQERALYDFLRGKTRQWLQSLVGSGKASKSYLNVLWTVLRLRQACNHPALVTKAFSNDDDLMSLTPEGTLTPTTQAQRKLNIGSLQQLLTTHMSSQLGWDASSQTDNIQQACELCGSCRSHHTQLYCVTCMQNIATYTLDATQSIPSTKITKALNLLTETRLLYPDEKTIIYSQFTAMLDLLEKPLFDNGFRFCRYDGSMSNQNREKSLKLLKTDPRCTVMLTSLKCGSLGLNLTAANRVILLDVWWNPAVEDQAIDRVHRIGQKRPVHVTRLLMNNSIEQKIVELQERKAMIAKGVLGDQLPSSSKVTVNELLSLLDL
ncbi:hypothetical protein DM01DRAFT_1311153 [Hesseltinella vesiculosa]|uniref:P-loop containing nucleoside triphosphate hydrolase protein n=1 Tax=Hesseltinella vesiculosa TaxID=101127 RepID=A0A1X2G6G2_9FUNG|nr:hypothetical protein DM01DRAFT_1311153 [Hesseltinella vesiculosa]